MSRDPEKQRERSRRWREANPEKRREVLRRYVEANPEKVRESRRRYYETNQEKIRRYREANRDKLREAQRRWDQANPEKLRESRRRYRETHREKVRESDRRRRIGNPWPHIWQAHGLRPGGWARMWADQDGRCYLCEEQLPENGDPRAVVVEHDHRCTYHPPGQSCPRCRRGLAHGACNTLIGLAGDDGDRLIRIGRNLKRARRQVTRRPQLALFPVPAEAYAPPPPRPPAPAANGHHANPEPAQWEADPLW